MEYSWYQSYRSAVLETDKPKMKARLLIAEYEMVARLRILAQNGGGRLEEREALADALNGIKTRRIEVNAWKGQSDSDA